MFGAFQTFLTIAFIPTCILFCVMDRRKADKLVIRATIAAQVLTTCAAVIFQPPLAMLIIMVIELFLFFMVKVSGFSYAKEYAILILTSVGVSLVAILDYVWLDGVLFWRDDQPVIYFWLNMLLSIMQLLLLGKASYNGRNRRTHRHSGDTDFYQFGYQRRAVPERRTKAWES